MTIMRDIDPPQGRDYDFAFGGVIQFRSIKFHPPQFVGTGGAAIQDAMLYENLNFMEYEDDHVMDYEA